jgi:hypothetical protein
MSEKAGTGTEEKVDKTDKIQEKKKEEKPKDISESTIKIKDKKGAERKIRAIKNTKGKNRELITEEVIEL